MDAQLTAVIISIAVVDLRYVQGRHGLGLLRRCRQEINDVATQPQPLISFISEQHIGRKGRQRLFKEDSSTRAVRLCALFPYGDSRERGLKCPVPAADSSFANEAVSSDAALQLFFAEALYWANVFHTNVNVFGPCDECS